MIVKKQDLVVNELKKLHDTHTLNFTELCSFVSILSTRSPAILSHIFGKPSSISEIDSEIGIYGMDYRYSDALHTSLLKNDSVDLHVVFLPDNTIQLDSRDELLRTTPPSWPNQDRKDYDCIFMTYIAIRSVTKPDIERADAALKVILGLETDPDDKKSERSLIDDLEEILMKMKNSNDWEIIAPQAPPSKQTP